MWLQRSPQHRGYDVFSDSYKKRANEQDRPLYMVFVDSSKRQIPSRLLWEACSHMLQLVREGCSYTYPPLSIAMYSFIQLREREQ